MFQFLTKEFLINYFVVTTVGILFHFLHTTFKKGVLIHILGAINESTWEHLKLVFWPMLFSGIYRFLINPIGNYWFNLSISILVAIIFIPALYYPIRFFIKKEILVVSISLYYVAVFIGLAIETYLTKYMFGDDIIGLVLLAILICTFIIFTYHPPKWFLFKDPVSDKYGDYK